MLRRLSGVVLAGFCCGLGLVNTASGSTPVDAASADSLHRRGLALLAEDTIESRQQAIVALDRATRSAPARAELWLDLGRACSASGYVTRARESYERAADLDPENAAAQLRLARACKWEWLSSLDPRALAHAMKRVVRAADLARGDPEPRLELSALALAQGNTTLAALAAESARFCDRENPQCLLALGCSAYRAGKLAVADSAFAAVLPLLPDATRARFDDVSSLTGGAATSASNDVARSDYWRANDPDLTTPENEARLDYMARVAHALLLFRDEQGARWDMRTELFVRYGLPAKIDYDPVDDPLNFHYSRNAPPVPVDYKPPPIEHFYHLQRWIYPALGIRADLWDQSLTQRYELAVSIRKSADPRPDPALVARRSDLVVLGDGRGVFLALPPGATPLAARAELSRFPAEAGTRLVAHLDAPGGTGDSLRATWVVVASDGREVARASGMLAVSACDPTERSVAEFAATLPPGEYRADVSVSGSARRRGVVHLRGSVSAAPPGLALSDLVLACGPEVASVGGGAVRVEPNFEHRVRGASAVAAYFEISHLTTGADGQSRFSYVYALRPAGIDQATGERARRVFEATREESYPGTLRRQFVTIPLRSIKNGAYDLEVEVRDLVAGATATGSVRFVKE